MDDVKRYWRDMVSSILKWSVGIYLLVVGWSVDNHDQFELRTFRFDDLDHADGAGLRAAGLILTIVLYVIGLHFIVARIYSRFLMHDVDATVLPRRVALTFCAIVSAFTLSVVLMTAVF